MNGDRKPVPYLKSKANLNQARFSPDGHWVVYTSNESGTSEVYVRPFPEVDKGRWQVSTSGGDSPLWSRDGREMFYRNADAVMAVSVKTDRAFSAEAPKILFHRTYVNSNFIPASLTLTSWDISPDGKRFLMMKEAASSAAAVEGPRHINIVLNWFEEVKQRVSAR